jgi:cell shape-determining protein MreC
MAKSDNFLKAFQDMEAENIRLKNENKELKNLLKKVTKISEEIVPYIFKSEAKSNTKTEVF